MSAALPVALVGAGAIGLEVARALEGRAAAALVAVVDPAPALVGRTLGELLGGAPGGPAVVARATEAFAASGARVAIVTTGSRAAAVAPQLEEAIAAGLHVVTTCEELCWLRGRDPALAERLDAAARGRGVVLLGVGVNPGLVMDRLPLLVAQACVRVDRISVERVVDAARRRGPLRAKVGAGMTVEELRAGVAAGRLGHAGLRDSCGLLARGLGLLPEAIDETIEPVISEDDGRGVARGRVAGVRQRAVARVGGAERVALALEMSVGAAAPHDRVVIEGDPPIELVIRGGVHGDRATVGTVLNALPAVLEGRPGLRSVDELALFGLLH